MPIDKLTVAVRFSDRGVAAACTLPLREVQVAVGLNRTAAVNVFVDRRLSVEVLLQKRIRAN